MADGTFSIVVGGRKWQLGPQVKRKYELDFGFILHYNHIIEKRGSFRDPIRLWGQRALFRCERKLGAKVRNFQSDRLLLK